jgi:hypothetical protein
MSDYYAERKRLEEIRDKNWRRAKIGFSIAIVLMIIGTLLQVAGAIMKLMSL